MSKRSRLWVIVIFCVCASALALWLWATPKEAAPERSAVWEVPGFAGAQAGDFVRFPDGTVGMIERVERGRVMRCYLLPDALRAQPIRIDLERSPAFIKPMELMRRGTPRWMEAKESFALQ